MAKAERDKKGRFIKGYSGNPNAKGRPPLEKSMAEIYRKLLNADEIEVKFTLPATKEHPSGKKVNIKVSTDISMRHAIASKVIIEALNGESWAVKEISDRTDGKPIQSVETSQKADIIELDSKKAICLDNEELDVLSIMRSLGYEIKVIEK